MGVSETYLLSQRVYIGEEITITLSLFFFEKTETEKFTVTGQNTQTRNTQPRIIRTTQARNTVRPKIL